jgi:hypothetical protein
VWALAADSAADCKGKQSRERSRKEDGEAGAEELAGVSLHMGKTLQSRFPSEMTNKTVAAE